MKYRIIHDTVEDKYYPQYRCLFMWHHYQELSKSVSCFADVSFDSVFAAKTYLLGKKIKNDKIAARTSKKRFRIIKFP